MNASVWSKRAMTALFAAGVAVALLSALGVLLLLLTTPGTPGAAVALMVMAAYWVGGWLIVDALSVIGSFVWLRRKGRAERLLGGGHIVLGLWAAALVVEYSLLKILGSKVDARLAPVHALVAAAILVVGRLRGEFKAAVLFAVWLVVETVADLAGSYPMALPLWAWGPLAFGGVLFLWQALERRRDESAAVSASAGT